MSWLQEVKFQIFKSKSQNVNTVKQFERISALVGREITAENFASLTEEEMAKIDAGQSTPPTNTPTETTENVVEQTEMSAQIQAAVEAAVSPLSKQLNEAVETVNGIEARLKTVEGKASTTPTATPLVNGNVNESPKHAWEDTANDPIAQQAMKDLGQA